MSLLHGDVEGFVDGFCDRVMWAVIVRTSGRAGLHKLVALQAEQGEADFILEDQFHGAGVVQAVKVRVDLRGVQ